MTEKRLLRDAHKDELTGGGTTDLHSHIDGGITDYFSKTIMRPLGQGSKGGDAGGAAGESPWQTYIQTGTIIGNKYYRGWRISLYGYLPIFDKNPIFDTNIVFRDITALTNSDRWIIFGRPANTTEPDNSDKIFGIHIINADLKLISSDGTTLTESASLMTMEVDIWYHVKVALNSGTNIQVWIDEISKGTKSTNLPSGNFKGSSDGLLFLVKTTDTVTKKMQFRHPRLQHDN